MTPLDVLYNSVWATSFWMFAIIGVIVCLVAGFITISASNAKLGCVTALVLVVANLGLAATNADTRADEAVTDGWDAAKRELSTFTEVLHAPWVSYSWDVHTCARTVNISPGCVYYTTREINHRRVCADRDDKGKCTSYRDESDTEYNPWFKFEWSPYARVDIQTRLAEKPLEVDDPNLPPRVYFAKHLAPEDWKNQIYCSFCSLGSFVSTAPEGWQKIRSAIQSGQVLVGNFYHSYMNYFHVTDDQLFATYGGDVPKYLQAGVLPKMESVYPVSKGEVAYQYNFVQFLSGVDKSNEAKWQSQASLWAAEAGPKLQASLMLFFAKEDSIPKLGVDSTINWINSAKVYLSNKTAFGKRILPKNLVLVGCAVSSDGKTVNWCRLETGMFMGNNGLKNAFLDKERVPFTPEAFFGNLTATYEGSKTQGQVVKAKVARAEGVLETLYQPQPTGFKRVSMGPFDYRMTNVYPTDDQKAKIAGDQTGKTFLFVLLESLVVIGLAVAFKAYKDS